MRFDSNTLPVEYIYGETLSRSKWIAKCLCNPNYMITLSTDEFNRIEKRAQDSFHLPISGEWDNLHIGKRLVLIDRQTQNRLFAFITAIIPTGDSHQKVVFKLWLSISR